MQVCSSACEYQSREHMLVKSLLQISWAALSVPSLLRRAVFPVSPWMSTPCVLDHDLQTASFESRAVIQELMAEGEH